MEAPQAASEISILIAETESGSISIGPLSVDPSLPWRGPNGEHDFIFGPITVVAEDGTRVVRESGNGIDAVRFANLRQDLHMLERERIGTVTFGDHDWFKILKFVARGEDVIHVYLTVPALDLWDGEIMTITWDRISAVIRQVDAVEAAFGALTGCCGACGLHGPTYAASHE
jgi:hypothetical protein